MEIDSDILERTIKCLGNFVWLKNNLHNYLTPEFRQILTESMAEAREVYQILEDIFYK